MTSAAPTPARPETPERKRRPTRVGVVSSNKRDKTIAVTVSYRERHAKYGKYLNRATVLHAHDEKNEAKVGDTVEIMECRPISKSKHWRLLRIISRSAGGDA